jgi:transcriptional regulator with XRE-family HTH domain
MIQLRPGALEAWRDKHGMTQAQLAKKAGVSRMTVWRIEHGQAESVTFGVVNRLAKALGEDADVLVTFEK